MGKAAGSEVGLTVYQWTKEPICGGSFCSPDPNHRFSRMTASFAYAFHNKSDVSRFSAPQNLELLWHSSLTIGACGFEFLQPLHLEWNR